MRGGRWLPSPTVPPKVCETRHRRRARVTRPGARSAWLVGTAVLAAAALIHSVATPGGAGAAAWQLPVLMYHRVDTALVARDPVTVSLTVMAPVFEAELRTLRDAGYRTLTLSELWAARATPTGVPERRIVLTFDDGYEDNYTVAFPLLRRYGFVGTFFVVTSTVGTRGHFTASQIQEMARAGMEFESHGQHHVDFSRLPLNVARSELVRSREIIGRWSGHPVAFFAYPAGRYSAALERLLADLGYHGALTEIPGFVTPKSEPFALERVRISHDDTPQTFAHKLHIPRP